MGVENAAKSYKKGDNTGRCALKCNGGSGTRQRQRDAATGCARHTGVSRRDVYFSGLGFLKEGGLVSEWFNWKEIEGREGRSDRSERH